MPVKYKYFVEYTLPGTRGKIQKKSFSSPEARKQAIAKIKEKGGNIKSVSSHD